MNFVVIVPFILVVIFWCLVASFAGVAVYGLWISLGFAFFYAALILGVCLLLVGAGRFIYFIRGVDNRRVLKWPTTQLVGMALGLFLFSFAFNHLFDDKFTRDEPYERTYTHTETRQKWIFFTESFSEPRSYTDYRKVNTRWYSAAQGLTKIRLWILLFSGIALYGEFWWRAKRVGAERNARAAQQKST